jgi:hypothetical protein
MFSKLHLSIVQALLEGVRLAAGDDKLVSQSLAHL